MSTSKSSYTRLECDECGADIDDPTEGDYGDCDTAAWLRYLAVEDGWVLDDPDHGDRCPNCVADTDTDGDPVVGE